MMTKLLFFLLPIFWLTIFAATYVLFRLAVLHSVYAKPESRTFHILFGYFYSLLKNSFISKIWMVRRRRHHYVSLGLLDRERLWLLNVSRTLSTAHLPNLRFISTVLAFDSQTILYVRLLSERKLPMDFRTFRSYRTLLLRVFINIFRQRDAHIYDALCRLTLAARHSGHYVISRSLKGRSPQRQILNEGPFFGNFRSTLRGELSCVLAKSPDEGPLATTAFIRDCTERAVANDDAHALMLVSALGYNLRACVVCVRAEGPLRDKFRRYLMLWCDALQNNDLDLQWRTALKLNAHLDLLRFRRVASSLEHA